jgi:CheY-like chemotaxis protein/two-component sensor histidine kinase
MTRIAKNITDNPLKISDSLGKIDMSSRYLLSLVNNILDISRIESDKMRINSEPFSLSNLLNDIQTLIQVQAEQKRINFNVIRKFGTDILIGDSLRISQVLVNLLGNAIKFTAECGIVDFTINEDVNDSEISKIQFIVKDSGIGIKKENTLKIFDSFEQGSLNIEKQYGGSGLGLSISNSLVKLMGGELEVVSEEGRGSEFFFTLVFYKGHKSTIVEKDDIHTISPKMEFIGKKVLLVEDDGLNAEFIQILLENAGFIVEIASNGKEAIEKYAKSKLFYYDFILMDIRMPVMDGKEATTYIRNLNRKDSASLPIIAMTANAFEEDKNESFNVGMNGHITKPIDMNVLYQELSKLFKDSLK